MKKRFLFILYILILSLCFFACGGNESIHPEGFDTYSPLLGKHTAPILEQLQLSENDLTLESFWHYKTPGTITFHGISFSSYLLMENTFTILNGFEYSASLAGSSSEITEQIYGLAQSLTESLGTSHDNSYWTDSQRIADFTVDELEDLLNSGEATRCTDYWSLGQVTTDEAVALKAFSEDLDAADGSAFKVLTEYPALLLEFTVYTSGDGTANVQLRYILDFFWY